MDVIRQPLSEALFRVYHKKSVRWGTSGHSIRLDLPVDVFSTFDVDGGTRRLIRRIVSAKPRWNKVLDLGCGYGPICSFLVAAGLAEKADAIDRDALAAAFADHNARANGLTDVIARGALAYEDVAAGRYDAIVTNLPAKAGRAVHRLMLLAADKCLRGAGEVWAVVVEPLQERIDEILAIDAVEIRQKSLDKGHVIYNYVFTSRPPKPAASYLRREGRFRWRGRDYSLRALHGLREFDGRSWATDLILDAFADAARARPAESILVSNPGQGHLPVLAGRLAASIGRMEIVCRDLLALKATEANLALDGYTGSLRLVHTAEPCLPGISRRP